MNKFFLASAIALSATSVALAESYTITVTNNLTEELLAPIVVTSANNDGHFFVGEYVTPAAEVQILTGDPADIIESIGAADAAVGHGMDGPPGVLLAAGDSVTFEFETEATALRILAMVAPTMVPDNYVSNVVDIHAKDSVTVSLDRFDIGHDEGTKSNSMIDESAATVVISKN